MTKAVVYSLLAIAFTLVMFYNSCHENNRTYNGLNRRFGLKFILPSFDPFVAELERFANEKDERNPTISNKIDPDKATDASEYPDDDEGSLNLTLRLTKMFPLMDTNPKDGLISLKELQAWTMNQADNCLNSYTRKELKFWDSNGDGAISFKEFLPQFSNGDTEKNKTGFGDAGWWKQQFLNADADKDGSLNFEEFKNFLHPEDSNNENIQKWLLTEEMTTMDEDNDGKLSFKEFLDHVYDTYRNHVGYETDVMDEPLPGKMFSELDVNKDRHLVVEELRPIINYLIPGEIVNAKWHAAYQMHEVDENVDGFLSLDEMLNNEIMFYNMIKENKEEDDDQYVGEYNL